MSQRFTITTTGNGNIDTICTVPADKVYVVSSIILYGGDTAGSPVFFQIDDGPAMMGYGVASAQTIHISDINLVLNKGETLKIYDNNAGGIVCSVSVIDLIS